MELILIAGLWLKNTVWDEVVTGLAAKGAKATALALPGVDDDDHEVTLEQQLAAATAAIDAADSPVTVVGHSAASTLAWLAADRRPDKVAQVVLIGGMPGANGASYSDFFEPQGNMMPFPGWQPFEGPDAEDLDAGARARLEAQMQPVPVGVSRGVIRYTDERRHAVPVVMVCPEYSVEDAQAWLEAGEIPELQPAELLTFIDIDSGHWPMISRPAELTELLARLATA